MFPRKLMSSVVSTLAALALVLGLSPAAHAASLDQAKKQGMVCEMPTGYLKATGGATGDVKEMVQDINAKREAEYTRIAEENGVRPDQVGKLTAQKLQPRCQ